MFQLPDLGFAFRFVIGAFCVLVPLAVWKVVDLFVLLSHHVSLSFH